MKVYGLPEHLPAPEFDWKDPDHNSWQKSEADHGARLKAYLVAAGYTGKNTGKILALPIADGNAQYMLAEGKTSCLIHLPYGDGWQSPDVRFLPKKEVLRRIGGSERIAEFFAKRTKESA